MLQISDADWSRRLVSGDGSRKAKTNNNSDRLHDGRNSAGGIGPLKRRPHKSRPCFKKPFTPPQMLNRLWRKPFKMSRISSLEIRRVECRPAPSTYAGACRSACAPMKPCFVLRRRIGLTPAGPPILELSSTVRERPCDILIARIACDGITKLTQSLILRLGASKWTPLPQNCAVRDKREPREDTADPRISYRSAPSLSFHATSDTSDAFGDMIQRCCHWSGNSTLMKLAEMIIDEVEEANLRLRWSPYAQMSPPVTPAGSLAILQAPLSGTGYQCSCSQRCLRAFALCPRPIFMPLERHRTSGRLAQPGMDLALEVGRPRLWEDIGGPD